LLDDLAARFVAVGWSFKWLHREILLSSSYGMSTKASSDARAKDPGNRLFSRFPRRRMSVEELRDSLLALDGSLDDTLGGSLLNPDRRKRRQNFDDITRRTMYLPVRRGSIPTLLSIFDYGDATTVSDGRSRTNVAPQALFLLNSPFVRSRAQGIAKRALHQGGGAAQIQWLYRVILNREAEASEVDDALTFLSGAQKQGESADDALASYCRVLLESNEFIYLN
jgi:hypothetical protein